MSTTQYDIEYCQSLSLTPILDFGFVVYNSCSSLCIDAPSAKKKSGRFFLGELASVHVHRPFLVLILVNFLFNIHRGRPHRVPPL